MARPPNKSDRLPKAVRLVRALRAPGLANNWANGMAEANELAAAAKGFVSCVVVATDVELVDDDDDDDVVVFKTLDVVVFVVVGDVVLVLLLVLLLFSVFVGVVVVVFKLFVFVVVLLVLPQIANCCPFAVAAAVVPFAVIALFASWRFAFCNSTL